MMTDRDAEILAVARAWIGTPYRHQASHYGVGCDCLGLIRGVWRALYGSEPETVPSYTPDWGEYDQSEPLMSGAQRHLTHAGGDMCVAQILLFRMRSGASAKHLGIVSATGAAPAFIHAYDGHGVVESPLSAPWQKRIAARFRFPD